jgi:DNA-binding transcriptional LysR family regulator
MEPKKVHAISSISAMVQLVQGGFGVALLPRAAVERLTGFASLKLLTCDTRLASLPIHASYRTDPTSSTVETVVKSAVEFAGEATGVGSGTKTGHRKVGKITKKSV